MNIKTTPLLFSLVLLSSACGPDNAFDSGEGFSSDDSGTTAATTFDTGSDAPPPDLADDGDTSTDGSGGDTCDPGTFNCDCSSEDLDADGMVPPAGECFLGLTCDAGICLSTNYKAGEIWGPCPMTNGVPTLCDEIYLACVPSFNGTHNVCLPVNGCVEAPYGSDVELGWGEACYPRCTSDGDCADGQNCMTAWSDLGSMCAWPVH